jgi:hypothetical protein
MKANRRPKSPGRESNSDDAVSIRSDPIFILAQILYKEMGFW